MAQALPIRFQEVTQLPNLGINAAAIGFATLTMESEKFICIREAQPGSDKTSVVIVDMANPSNVSRRPISADSAIMNPKENILALKAGQQLQIFNIEKKEKIKAYQMPDPVIFWKWVNPTTLVLITGAAVFHWTLDATTDPVKIFERHPSLADCQIINYKADNAMKWLCVIGIAQREGRIVGAMQLYSTEKQVSQAIEGHAAAFADYTLDGAPGASVLFAFAKKTATDAKLYVIEVAKKTEGGPEFQRKAVDIMFPPEAQGDFPVAMQISNKYNVVYLITKFGYFHMFDLETATLIYRNRISSDTIFVTCNHDASGGFLGVDRKGRVLLIGVDENNLVPYIAQQVGNLELAIKYASRYGLSGADDLIGAQFRRLFQQGMYKEAAAVVAGAQGLRNQQTIDMYKQLPAQPGQPSPLLQYFGVLLEKSRLNKLETIELARPVIAQQRVQLLEKWFQEDKLTASEELGDLIKPQNLKLALQVYFKAEVHPKVVISLAESGEYDKIPAYCQRVGYQPDWMYLIGTLMTVNPDAASKFAASVISSGAKLNVTNLVDGFMSRGMIQQTTAFLLEVLKGNKPEDGPLQTKLLEINLIHAPQVADAILGNDMFTQYDKARIGGLAEKAGLFQRALEHYTELNDIKRVMQNTHAINPEFLVGYFSRLSVEQSLECLKNLLRINIRQNLPVVVQICNKFAEQLSAEKVVEMFESFNCFEGLFYFLGAQINVSQDPVVHNKYIQAAAKTGQVREVERVCRESNFYDAEKTKEFLKEAKLPDQLPLIIVCDRYDFVDDLTRYLYKNNMSRYIEAYVQKINPMNTPTVIGALIDSGCNEDYIKNLIMSVRNACPIEPLVEVVEKRHKLKLILPWLEARVAEGNTEPALHNTLAKVTIDSNKDPETFLKTNPYYDSKTVGKYCEKRDPYLAFVSYKRGRCDDELLEITNKEGLFKHQARYLVERQDLELWAKVLNDSNEYKKSAIDQVVQVALPETNNPEEVSTTVKAFMAADMPNELIELLDKIVLGSKNSEFSENRNLQNLLILTAIKADSTRVMDYINRLDKYDGPDIAVIAISAELFEEAFAIYKKSKLNVDAVTVLLNNLRSIERAKEFAVRVNEPEVFSKLGKAQLEENMVTESITSFIKASDPQYWVTVIGAANSQRDFADLVKFLEMCITKMKEPKLESELVFAYAMIEELAKLEEFISRPSCCANILEVGDRCFEQGLFLAAKTLYNNISNFGKLASALVRLGDFSGAVESARKANSVRTWKEVNLACVEVKEFRLAQVAGLFIVQQPDELDELIRVYEARGHFQEAIALLEGALTQENPHTGLFTELAILFSKYKEEKLMGHLKTNYNRINLAKVIHHTQANYQWPELTFLYIHYDEFDNAALTMINHSSDAWEHPLFKDVLKQVHNVDICYRGVQFYIEEQPLLVNDLLSSIRDKIDHTRVVQLARKLNQLPLVKGYLSAVQDKNIPAVNEAINELYVEEEDYEGLRASIERFDAFDNMHLAQSCEKHELLEFRRIAAVLYKKNGRFAQSVELSKNDKLYKDAIQCAADSKKQDIAESLLEFFVKNNHKECFAATLYTCYSVVRPDVALELAWKHQITDFAMPFLIQVLREYTSKVDNLIDSTEKAKKAAKEQPDSFAAPPVSESVFANQIPQIAYYPTDPMNMGGIPNPNVGFGGMPGTPNMGMPGYGMGMNTMGGGFGSGF